MKETAAKARREAERGPRSDAPSLPVDVAVEANRPPMSTVSGRALLLLQRSAGNAAVARLLVQRKGDGGSCPPPPVAPSPADPQADPKFKKVAADAKGTAKELKKHPPPAAEAKKAQDAALPPTDDKASQAKAAQADTMAAAKPKGFDKPAFIAAVKSAIAAAAPKNLDEADKFASSSKPDQIKASVASKVSQGKDASGKDVAEKTKQAPDPSRAKEKPVVPLKEEPPPKPGAVAGAKAMPDKAPQEQVDLRAGSCEVDAKMKDEAITEDQLKASNEAPMQEAVTAKKEAEAHAAEAPAAVRQKEAATLQSARTASAADAKTAVAAMAGTKGQQGGRVAAQKAAAKAKEEADRARISAEINVIFDRTKTETEAILNGLDTKVSTAFDAGEAQAKAAFTAKHTADMEKYKDDRYSGPAGWARWTDDLFTGLPPEANRIYERAKAVYESKMTEVISNVADIVGAELDAAKARIDKGRAEIKAYVDRQPKELQKLAGDTANEVGERFNELETQITEKSQALVNDVAQRYVEARNKVDEEIKVEQEKNKGLVDKAMDAVGGAVEAIMKLKDLFMGVLAKAANAFTKILDDPLAFIGNFMNAIKQGFLSFANNILDHLKKGLMGWLLGALANAGIEIPDSFDLKGILKLVASILGLTWSSIKARIVRMAPWIAKAIDFVESKVEVFAILATQGVVGVWEWIKDKVGDLTEMVLGPIKEFVVEKIVKAGISWVLGMLNPAGALIKIVQALIGVVQWVMERGAQLAEFVSTVVDSVSDVAHGGLGGVPAKIEGALSKAVPLVISFLANLLGLGGISEKIKSVLEAVQKPVGKAIDAVIKGALKAAKGLMRGLGLGKKRKAKDDPARVRQEVEQALSSRLDGNVDGPGPVRSAFDSVYGAYKDKGLKKLKLRHLAPGSFGLGITVSRKPLTNTRLNAVRDLKFVVKIIDEGTPEETRKSYHPQHTALSAIWNGRSLPRQESAGPEHHAEDMLIDYIENQKKFRPPPKTNTLNVTITKSPCPRCGKKLQRFASKRNTQLGLTLIGLYTGGTGGGGPGSGTAKKVKNVEVLIKLSSAGVKLKVPSLNELLQMIDGKVDKTSKALLRNKLAEMARIVKAINAGETDAAKVVAGR